MILESIVNYIDYILGWATVKARTVRAKFHANKAKTLGEELYNLAEYNSQCLTPAQRTSYRLLAIRLGCITKRGFGICSNVGYAVGVPIIRDLFPKWPQFSGDIDYPIPSPNQKTHYINAYYKYPLWKGAYGEERLDLVRFLSNELTQKIIDRAKKKGHNAKISLLEEAWEFVKENGL